MSDWYEKQEQKLRLVAWPSPQDYNEAIQNPSSCFEDQELVGLSPELTALGLPKPATGNFASVYKLTGDGSEIAVRCFLHPLKDEQARYAALSIYLQKHALPNCVRFEFVPTGIKIHDHWRPIVKMDWAHGDSLIDHLHNILTRPDQLNDLAERFKQMVLRMSERGIAHGDLQHSNIIVDGEQIKLVDYDAIYVPELAGGISNEIGHPNYQHPQRTATFFNDKLDRFSAWVIYTSLRILAIDPSTWRLLNAGDDCLLFRHTDYINPLKSKTFFALETHPDQQVCLLARQIRRLLAMPIEDLPNLDAAMIELDALPPVEAPETSSNDWSESVSVEQLSTTANEQTVWPSLPESSTTSGAAAYAAKPLQKSMPSTVAFGILNKSFSAKLSAVKRFVAANSVGVFFLIVPVSVVMIAIVFKCIQVSGQWSSPAQEQNVVAAVPPTATTPDSQYSYNQAMEGSLADDQIYNLLRTALKENASDHALSNEQQGDAWYQIGQFACDHGRNEEALKAYQSSYSFYEKSNFKYVNILDEITAVLFSEKRYLDATQNALKALQVGLIEHGVDWNADKFDGADEISSIASMMSYSIKQEPESAFKLYTKIFSFLDAKSSDSKETGAKRLACLRQFIGEVAAEATRQVDAGNVVNAQRLANMIGDQLKNDKNHYLSDLQATHKNLLHTIHSSQGSHSTRHKVS